MILVHSAGAEHISGRLHYLLRPERKVVFDMSVLIPHVSEAQLDPSSVLRGEKVTAAVILVLQPAVLLILQAAVLQAVVLQAVVLQAVVLQASVLCLAS